MSKSTNDQWKDGQRPSPTDKTQWELELLYPDQDHEVAHGSRVLNTRKRTVIIIDQVDLDGIYHNDMNYVFRTIKFNF